MLERQGFGGSLTVTDDLDRAVDGRRLRPAPAPGRRPGGAARGRDGPARLRLHRPGDDGRRRLREGDAHRAGRPRDRRSRAGARAPDAWIVDFTNPVGIVTRALLDAGHRAIGLCNVAIGVPARDRAAPRDRAGARARRPRRPQPPDLGPPRARRRRGRPPRAAREHGDELARGTPGSRVRLLEELGAIPSSYLRYFYAPRRRPRRAADGVPRAVEVAEIERACSSSIATPRLAEKPALLEQRGGAFYSEAATALIASLVGRQRRRPGRRRRNGGTVAGPRRRRRRGAPRADRRRGAEPLPQAPLAPELLGLVQHVAAYERLAAEAAVTRDPVTARKALLAHPLIGQDELGGTLARALLADRRARAAGAR